MFTHIDSVGRPSMVDISEKRVTYRVAIASVCVRLPEGLISGQARDPAEIFLPKGPVFQTAVIAGTMAVKKTHELIPFCHSLPIERCQFHVAVQGERDVLIECEVATSSKTGVEMEALTGASIAALTVYDMCKSFSHDIVIGPCRLLKKSGGKSDVTST